MENISKKIGFLVGMLFAVAVSALGCVHAKTGENEAVIFITIGQSNADGSAFADSVCDSEMKAWYEDSLRTHNMKIWFRSCKVKNQASNALGEAARWCVDDSSDIKPQWMDLWYKNDIKHGRTAMQMIHGFGSTSEGASKRRGIEGAFGKKFTEEFPDKELYVIKLGVSGSQISTWAYPEDETNWRYFLENVYKPAMNDLLEKGKTPVLAGVFWMQGCGDQYSREEYYEEMLKRLISNLRNETGFSDAKFYVGKIMGPGENEKYPNGSVQYGEGVMKAKEKIAEEDKNVELVDTKDCDMQYEKGFGGYLHFNHKGVNTLGTKVAEKIAENKDSWSKFSKPETWDR